MERRLAILEERGLFWWSREQVPIEQFAPDNSVSGTLTIQDDGSAALELDGVLPSKHGVMSAFVGSELPDGTCISGLLKGTAKHVLLTQLAQNGANMSAKGISFERYIASICLVSLKQLRSIPKFKELVMPLSGYEEWLGLNAVTIEQTARSTSAKYKRPAPLVYRLSDQKLTIAFDLKERPYLRPFNNEFFMKQAATATIRYAQSIELEDILKQYQLFEDLLIMFTTKECALDWPSAVSAKDRLRIYFRRSGRRSTSSIPKFYECIATFPKIRTVFGSVWEKWRARRETVGPGLFLYLGTRRGIQMYLEHRFVNLIWAIESFHRSTQLAAPAPPLKRKIERIVREVSRANDRKWLENRLAFALEPALSDRIFEILNALPLGIDRSRLYAFATVCARLRNDISHFGGKRNATSSYDSFLEDVHQCADALSILYQLVLLADIGVDSSILKKWIFEGPRSYPIKESLKRANLLF